MKIKLLLFVGSILFLFSCSAKLTSNVHKTYPPIDYRQEIRIFGLEEETPPNAEILGTIKVGDTGFSTDCDYITGIELIKQETRKSGGNAFKIIRHKTPGMSTCHRIKAEVLRVPDVEEYALPIEKEIDSLMLESGYAIINVYRMNGPGALVDYNLYLGDSILCRVSANYREAIKVDKDGLNILWAKTETRSEVPIKVEYGRTYYLRCGVSTGAFVGRPKIELVDNEIGRIEIKAILENRWER